MSTAPRQSLLDEPIAAVITPPGEGGVAAIRIAGPGSHGLLREMFAPSHGDDGHDESFVMRHGRVVARSGDTLDEVMAVTMPHGKSYTGEEQAEIFCHGGRLVVTLILEEILARGARAAEPGEFTRLAFLNGRIDLARAEAVAEVIAANTQSSLAASREHLLGAYTDEIDALRAQLIGLLAETEAMVDFAEEEIDPADRQKLHNMVYDIHDRVERLRQTYRGGRILREGFRIAIAGRPNAGKSSLFNLLLRQERALVTSTPGTTRDFLDEWIDLGGYAVNLIDTAGLRAGGGKVEQAGQERAREIISRSDLLLWLVDMSQRGWADQIGEDIEPYEKALMIVLANKLDLIKKPPADLSELPVEAVAISCKTCAGIDELKGMLVERIEDLMPDLTSGAVVTSARHHQKLTMAADALKQAVQKIAAGASPELTAFDVRQAVTAVDEITGRVYTEEVLGQIFSRFCIGK